MFRPRTSPLFCPFAPWIDPLEPYDPGKICTNYEGYDLPCGPLVNHMTLDDFDCWAERVVAPFHNHTRESVFVHFSNASWPNFKFTGEHHLVDGDVTVAINTTGDAAVEIYTTNTLKVAYTWQHYPWVGDPNIVYVQNTSRVIYNNGSAFEFWGVYDRTCFALCVWNPLTHSQHEYSLLLKPLADLPILKLGLKYLPKSNFCNPTKVVAPFRVNMSYYANHDNNALFVEGLDKPVHLSLNFSRTFVADGVGFSQPYHVRSVALEIDSVDIHPQSAFSISDGRTGHWTTLGYDPSLSSLFDSVASPPTPSGANRSKRIWPYIVGAAVVVLVLVVAAVLVVTFVPAAKKLVRPFRNRKDLAKTRSSTTESSSVGGWKMAERPATGN